MFSQWRRRLAIPNRVFLFASTSKITFAGAGVSFFASSPSNVDWYLKNLSKRTIGPDKINHLRHALYLKGADGVAALMRRHREILAPKFDQVTSILEQAARRVSGGNLDRARWWVLRQPRRCRWHCEPRGRAGQAGRDRDDRSRGGLPLWPRPT